MSELMLKIRQAKYRFKNEWLTIENVVLAIALTACLIWTWGSISSMSRNWSLAQELASRQREKALLELEVDTLELENEYYLSAEYQELAARKYQGKKLPGETMVVLPDNSEAALNKHSDTSTTEQENPIGEMSNFEQWMLFLFGI